MPAGGAGIRGPGGRADQRAPVVRDGGRGDVHEPGHARATAGGHDVAGAGDVDPGELAVPALDVDLGGEVHDGVVACDGGLDGRGVDDVGEHLAVP